MIGYHKDWRRIRLAVLRRDNWTCQDCGAKQHSLRPVPPPGLFPMEPGPPRGIDIFGLAINPPPDMRTHVHLQASHINHIKADCRLENLRALCERCHGLNDSQQSSRKTSATKQRKAAARTMANGQTTFEEMLAEIEADDDGA